MRDKIQIQSDDRGSFVILNVNGELSERTVNYFKHTVLEIIDDLGYGHMVIDFSNCDYINSVGIGVLNHISKKLIDLGGKLGVVNPSESVRDVLAVTSESERIREYESIEDAAEDLQE